MSLKLLNESLERILLLETKQDIENFKNKFGEKNYELFNQSRDRLKNNGYSTDIIYYTQKVSKEELEDLLSKLQRKLQTKSSSNSNISSEGIRGKYNYLGESKGYKVYQPLDYLSSIDLGYMSGWCTTGRYGHAGERDCKPSEKDARKHFKDYTSKGIELYYFLDSKTMEGKYAIAKYPKLLEVNEVIGDYYIVETNFELFNQEDDIDYSALDKIPYQLLPEELIVEKADAENGLYIKNNILVKADNNIKEAIIPNSVTMIGDYAFDSCSSLEKITIPNSVKSIGKFAFYDCDSLTSIIFEENSQLISIDESAFGGCSSLTSIKIPNSVISIDKYAFYDCISLTSVIFEENSQLISIGSSAFSYCRSLTTLTIPNSVTSIGSSAFYGCTQLKDVYYSGTEYEWNNIKMTYGNEPLLNATIHFNSK